MKLKDLKKIIAAGVRTAGEAGRLWKSQKPT